MTLNKGLQKRILETAALHYPDRIPPKTIFEILEPFSSADACANVAYLSDHGLLNKGAVEASDEGFFVATVKATQRGMDFLEPDGGLTEIFETVTIRIHEDSIRAILEAKIAESPDLTGKEKAGFLQRLKELPADSIKHLTLRLLDTAVDSSPQAIDLISRHLS
ncbi:hypothetical protein [Carnimonas bestiolae]|uniref:hypothetical protein n=1 Tax=Carnimonas bestiolae TaxID=3402172 RepID=UPI003F4AAA54